VYVVSVINPQSNTVITGVPVQLLNQEVLAASGLAIAGSEHYSVDVHVEGTRSDILSLQSDQITATADLFGMSKGQNYLVVAVSVPEKITVTEVRSNRIPVLIDELVSVQKAVTLHILDGSAGSEVGGVQLNPQEVGVSGAKSIVDNVRSVRVEVSQSSLSDAATAQLLTAVAVDSEGNPVPHVRLSHAYVELSASLYRTKTVPLEVPVEGIPAGEAEITRKEIPASITVKGPRQALENVEAIAARPLNIQGITESISLVIEPILPESIEVASDSLPLEAHFTLVSMSEVTFIYKAEDIWVYNVPSGYRIQVLSPEVTVSARGEEAVISILQAKDLQPAINAANVSLNAQEATLTTRYAQQLVKISIAPASARIRVTVGNNPPGGQE
jgi:YbbR domain-containing protein